MHNQPIDTDAFTAFAKGLAGQDIPTAGGRTTFRVRVDNGDMTFILTSGNERIHQRRYVEKVLDQFNSTGELRTPPYVRNNIVNASYQLGLIKMYLSTN